MGFPNRLHNQGKRNTITPNVREIASSMRSTIVSPMQRRAPRNHTLSCTGEEILQFSHHLLRLCRHVGEREIEGRLILGDFFKVAQQLPSAFVDLLILDPPYNLSKNFNGEVFKKKGKDGYRLWFQQLIDLLVPMLKPQATVYVCSDWRTSTLIQPILESKFCVRNRITWEREKGRGAKKNWKNNTEDIWFCTKSDRYYFDVESVKLKRKVLAPYRADGKPKDWQDEATGAYRLTHPSNIWTDLTVPFWSMHENTDHPTQKPEKLLAKLILASSRKGDLVFDPFLGSGTTAVVAQKLSRRWCGIDVNAEYLCWAMKRISAAKDDAAIQGYADGVFWERNSVSGQPVKPRRSKGQAGLFS